MKYLVALALAALVTLTSGCAMLTGTATGAFTGAVDAPAETYRANREAFAETPILHAFNVLIIGPLGIATGPLFGLGKGLSLDVQWVIDQMEYGPVFGSYAPMSIWRPHTLRWPIKNPPLPPPAARRE